jgi:glycosyltransferase involved in cell wall biosynthesis
LNGWAYLTDWFVLVSAKFNKKKVWMRSEMPWNQEELKPYSVKKKIKFIFFKYLIFKYFVDKFIYIGSQNKKYYQMYGIEESRLIYGPYSVDNKKFQDQKMNPVTIRQKWGIQKDNIVILFSGKLIGKKNPLDLLKAFEKLKINKTVLFFMGDGPLRRTIEDYTIDNGIENVVISGFVNQSEIGSIYFMSDVFVMCSGVGETWGLSVNEAMNFNLPIVISSTCGSSFDLIDEGKNGFVYKEGDIEMLVKVLAELVPNQILRNKMGLHSKQKIAQFTHEITCQNIGEHLR